MKKVMFALAIAAIGSAFAIESSNVVGYNQGAFKCGATVYTAASFLGIDTKGADSFKIGQISAKGTGFDTWNNDYLATVDLVGMQDKYYTFNEEDGHWYEADSDGMITGDIADDVELPINKGIIILSNNGVNLTFSGAVMSGDTELYVKTGATCYTGNFTPSEITLGDLVVSGGFDTWNNDYLATIQDNGMQDQYYTYNQEDGNWYYADSDGMIVGDIANSVKFAANKGFIILGNSSDFSISLPSPLK